MKSRSSAAFIASLMNSGVGENGSPPWSSITGSPFPFISMTRFRIFTMSEKPSSRERSAGGGGEICFNKWAIVTGCRFRGVWWRHPDPRRPEPAARRSRARLPESHVEVRIRAAVHGVGGGGAGCTPSSVAGGAGVTMSCGRSCREAASGADEGVGVWLRGACWN